MVEDWRDLRVGDRIRIVRLPSYAMLGGNVLHRDTRRLYKRLIARKRPLRVYQLDERWQLSWIKCKFRMKNGRREYNFLAVNDDSWVRVKSRAHTSRGGNGDISLVQKPASPSASAETVAGASG